MDLIETTTQMTSLSEVLAYFSSEHLTTEPGMKSPLGVSYTSAQNASCNLANTKEDRDISNQSAIDHPSGLEISDIFPID